MIGVFDSGVGGLTVVKEIFKELPNRRIIYFGDTARLLSKGAKLTHNGKIGIIATPGTIKSGSWEKNLLKLNPELKIYSKPCPLFVPLVEEGWVNKKITEEVAEEY